MRGKASMSRRTGPPGAKVRQGNRASRDGLAGPRRGHGGAKQGGQARGRLRVDPRQLAEDLLGALVDRRAQAADGVPAGDRQHRLSAGALDVAAIEIVEAHGQHRQDARLARRLLGQEGIEGKTAVGSRPRSVRPAAAAGRWIISAISARSGAVRSSRSPASTRSTKPRSAASTCQKSLRKRRDDEHRPRAREARQDLEEGRALLDAHRQARRDLLQLIDEDHQAHRFVRQHVRPARARRRPGPS